MAGLINLISVYVLGIILVRAFIRRDYGLVYYAAGLGIIAMLAIMLVTP